MRTLITRNPPGPADLDEALTADVMVMMVAMLTFAAACGAMLAALLYHRSGYVPLGFLVPWLALPLARRRRRRGGWLGRAVAVVGTRPEIGYAWLSRLPDIKRQARIGRILLYCTIPGLMLLAFGSERGDTAVGAAGAVAYCGAWEILFAHVAYRTLRAAPVVRARLAETPAPAGFVGLGSSG